ncbi:prephenate dehydrogenase [Paucilactobacillus kaifaensis]|uniref:prephenate dehydrogenase n=1 Tax=Paucilactobacillus kaifaensis TaxID=2559921 RepID=UPI0010F77D43|nr:prephenate dehydrogenase/arogenate dehydrogenase family protein [Paucilactobacillus kaifaensis]
MKIVVVGLGEMGASLALAIKNSQPDSEIIGVDADEQTLTRSQKIGLTSQVAKQLGDVAEIADVIVLATPTKIIIELLHQLRHLQLKKNVIITDTGSTKVQVMNAAKPLIEHGILFVGGHAMAGTQKAGIEAVNANLYDQVPYFLITENKIARQRVKKLLRPLHVNFVDITAQKHDHIMAQLSDLPHIAAAALVNSTEATLNDEPQLPRFAAGGFKDTTRIGAADPQMWTDVLLTNRDATLAALEGYQQQIQQIIDGLKRDDAKQIHSFFESSKQIRSKFEE